LICVGWTDDRGRHQDMLARDNETNEGRVIGHEWE
jgi:hypothetical protein